MKTDNKNWGKSERQTRIQIDRLTMTYEDSETNRDMDGDIDRDKYKIHIKT